MTAQVPNPGGPAEFAKSIEEQRAVLTKAAKDLASRRNSTWLTARADRHDALQPLALVFCSFSRLLRSKLGKGNRVLIRKGADFVKVLKAGFAGVGAMGIEVVSGAALAVRISAGAGAAGAASTVRIGADAAVACSGLAGIAFSATRTALGVAC